MAAEPQARDIGSLMLGSAWHLSLYFQASILRESYFLFFFFLWMSFSLSLLLSLSFSLSACPPFYDSLPHNLALFLFPPFRSKIFTPILINLSYFILSPSLSSLCSPTVCFSPESLSWDIKSVHCGSIMGKDAFSL